MADLDSIQKKIIAFRNECDWAHFHEPMNLTEALSIEAGELLENFLCDAADQFRTNSSLKAQNYADYVAESICP